MLSNYQILLESFSVCYIRNISYQPSVSKRWCASSFKKKWYQNHQRRGKILFVLFSDLTFMYSQWFCCILPRWVLCKVSGRLGLPLALSRTHLCQSLWICSPCCLLMREDFIDVWCRQGRISCLPSYILVWFHGTLKSSLWCLRWRILYLYKHMKWHYLTKYLFQPYWMLEIMYPHCMLTCTHQPPV